MTHDPVERPRHYTTHPSGYEMSDLAETYQHNLGAAIKYLWRRADKGDQVENLEKALWYVNREIKRFEDDPVLDAWLEHEDDTAASRAMIKICTAGLTDLRAAAWEIGQEIARVKAECPPSGGFITVTGGSVTWDGCTIGPGTITYNAPEDAKPFTFTATVPLEAHDTPDVDEPVPYLPVDDLIDQAPAQVGNRTFTADLSDGIGAIKLPLPDQWCCGECPSTFPTLDDLTAHRGSWHPDHAA